MTQIGFPVYIHVVGTMDRAGDSSSHSSAESDSRSHSSSEALSLASFESESGGSSDHEVHPSMYEPVQY